MPFWHCAWVIGWGYRLRTVSTLVLLSCVVLELSGTSRTMQMFIPAFQVRSIGWIYSSGPDVSTKERNIVEKYRHGTGWFSSPMFLPAFLLSLEAKALGQMPARSPSVHLGQWFSTEAAAGRPGDIFGWHNYIRVGACYWHLVGRNQRRSWTLYSGQNRSFPWSPPQ